MDSVEPSPEYAEEKGDPVSRDPIENIRKLLKRRVPRPKKGKSEKQELKSDGSGAGIWRAVALISFVMNLLFLALILMIGTRLFSFKTIVVEPLLDGVYRAVGEMDDIEVQTEVEVISEVPVAFDLALQRDTMVTLSQPTRIEGAYLSIRSATFSVDAPSTIDLPIGTQLPITLDLTVPVNTTIPVELSVPVDLALTETEMQPAIQAIQELVEPCKQLVEEIPDCWQMLLWGGTCPK
jgi:hypothetical protein